MFHIYIVTCMSCSWEYPIWKQIKTRCTAISVRLRQMQCAWLCNQIDKTQTKGDLIKKKKSYCATNKMYDPTCECMQTPYRKWLQSLLNPLQKQSVQLVWLHIISGSRNPLTFSINVLMEMFFFTLWLRPLVSDQECFTLRLWGGRKSVSTIFAILHQHSR